MPPRNSRNRTTPTTPFSVSSANSEAVGIVEIAVGLAVAVVAELVVVGADAEDRRALELLHRHPPQVVALAADGHQPRRGRRSCSGGCGTGPTCCGRSVAGLPIATAAPTTATRRRPPPARSARPGGRGASGASRRAGRCRTARSAGRRRTPTTVRIAQRLGGDRDRVRGDEPLAAVNAWNGRSSQGEAAATPRHGQDAPPTPGAPGRGPGRGRRTRPTASPSTIPRDWVRKARPRHSVATAKARRAHPAAVAPRRGGDDAAARTGARTAARSRCGS